jgi:hypothetical protein
MGEQAAQVLAEMSRLIKQGDIQAACELGNQHTPPLAVPKAAVKAHELLGTGSESTIHAAELDGVEAAYKRYKIRNAADLERYRKELALLLSLRHQHVVPVLAARAIPPDYSVIIPRYDCSLEVSF